jgi:hypothetical protein
MYSLRIIAALIASTLLLIISSLITFAADTSAMATAFYLPDELMQLPPKVEITADLSGYWAGKDAPLIRCIKIERPWPIDYGDKDISRSYFEPMEVAPGVVLGEDGERDLLLFYYLSANSTWQRIGYYQYYWITEVVPIFDTIDGANNPILKASIVNGGNARSQKEVCCFVFQQNKDGSITFHDKAPNIEGMPIVDLYPKHSLGFPEYVAYPTMGTNWEIGLPFFHYGNPDRYVLLHEEKDGTLTNVSAKYPSFYLEMLGYGSFLELITSAASGERAKNLSPSNTYLPEIIQILIAYHDMGYGEDGVKIADSLANIYEYGLYDQGSAILFINSTVVRLNEQDKLIREAIDYYNADISAATW